MLYGYAAAEVSGTRPDRISAQLADPLKLTGESCGEGLQQRSDSAEITIESTRTVEGAAEALVTVVETGRVDSNDNAQHEAMYENGSDAARNTRRAFGHATPALLDAMPMLVWISDSNLDLVYQNPHATEYLGTNQLKFAPAGWQAVVHPDDAELFARKWNGAQSAASGQFRVRFRRASDGAWRWHLGETLPFASDPDTPLWLWVFCDVHQGAVDGPAEGPAVQSLATTREIYFETDEQDRWRYLSPTWTRITGRSVHSSLGEPCQDAFSEATFAKVVTQWRKLYSGSAASACIEAELRTSRGKYRWMDVCVQPVVSKQGRITGLAGTLRDISEQKCAQKQALMAQEQAHRATRQKSEFLAAISSEMRTPLKEILRLGTLLSKSTHCSESDMSRSICDTVQGLLLLLNNVFDLSRLEAGALKLSPGPTDLRLATEDVIETWTARADQKHIDLVLEFSPDLPKRVMIDAARYRQLLSLFIENAIDATSRGYVRLSIEVESIWPSDVSVLIRIEDTGSEAGSPQNDASRSKEAGYLEQGTSLRLALAHHLLVAMDGLHAVDRDPNRGTTVTLRMSFTRDPEEWPNTAPASSLNGVAVLVAATSVEVRRGVISTLERTGVRTCEAATFREAMTVLEREHRAKRPIRTVFVSSELADAAWEPAIRERGLPLQTAFVLLARSTEIPQSADAQRAGYHHVLPRNPRRNQVLAALTDGDDAGMSQVNPLHGSRGHRAISCVNSREGVTVLLITADPASTSVLTPALDEVGCNYCVVESAEGAIEAVSQRSFDVVLVDDTISESDPIELTKQIIGRQRTKPSGILLFVNEITDELRVSSDALGSIDLFQKPIEPAVLRDSLLTAPKHQSHPLTFDQKALLSRCRFDTSLLRDVTVDFCSIVPSLLAALTQETVRQNSAPALEAARAIHTAAQLVGANQLCASLTKISENIELQDWAEAAGYLAEVKSEILNLVAEFPSAHAEPQTNAISSSAEDNSSAVLVIHRDPLSCRFAERVLTRAGYTVVSAQDLTGAKTAWSARNSQYFSCLIADVAADLTECSEVLEWVKGENDGTAVVVVTGSSDSSFLQATLRAGASHVLNKPLDRSLLETAVDESVELTTNQRRAAEMQRDVQQIGAAQRALIHASIGSTPDLELCLHPKYEAGGDFVSYYRISESRAVTMITDVSGHDLNSAFLSAYFQGMVRAMLEAGASLSSVFARGNASLLNEWSVSTPGLLMSVSAGSVVVDRATRQIEVVRCGTPSPVFTGMNGECFWLAAGASHPLGWFEDYAFEQITVPLTTGNITMWTDGVEERAAELDVSPCAFAVMLLKAQRAGIIPDVVKNANDDILAAHIVIGETDNSADRCSMFYPVLNETYTPEDLSRIDDLQRMWKRSILMVRPDTDERIVHDTLLCAREGVLNALKHGCADGGTASLRLTISPVQGRVVLQVEDEGPGHSFDALAHDDLEDGNLPDQHRGILLMRAVSNCFRSERMGAKITMEFRREN